MVLSQKIRWIQRRPGAYEVMQIIDRFAVARKSGKASPDPTAHSTRVKSVLVRSTKNGEAYRFDQIHLNGAARRR